MNNRMLPEQFPRDEASTYDRLIAEISALAPEEGIRHIKQFLMTYPSFPQAHNDLGVLYLRAGNSTLALAHCEKASRLQPDNITFRKNLADFYAVELGWLEDAVDIYLEILKRNPRDTEALIALGQIGSAMEGQTSLPQPLQVAPALQAPVTPPVQFRPIEAAPVNPVSKPVQVRSSSERYEAAAVLANGGKLEAAIAELKELLLHDPAFALAHNDLGVLCQQAGDLDAALLGHRQAVELQPANSTFRKNLADFLLVCKEDIQGALEQYNSLLAKNPRDLDVLQAIARICLKMDNVADARHFLERALSVEPWNRDVREALQKLKEIEAAPVPAVPRKSADELYQDALELAGADKLDDARNLLELLLRGNPQHALAHNDLGVICYRLGDVAGAERHYQQAAQLEPACANYQKNLADLYFTELGKADDAIHIYLDLQKKYPRDVEVLLNLGHICTAVGHGEEAKSFYRRALEIEPWNSDARSALQAPMQSPGKAL